MAARVLRERAREAARGREGCQVRNGEAVDSEATGRWLQRPGPPARRNGERSSSWGSRLGGPRPPRSAWRRRRAAERGSKEELRRRRVAWPSWASFAILRQTQRRTVCINCGLSMVAIIGTDRASEPTLLRQQQEPHLAYRQQGPYCTRGKRREARQEARGCPRRDKAGKEALLWPLPLPQRRPSDRPAAFVAGRGEGRGRRSLAQRR